MPEFTRASSRINRQRHLALTDSEHDGVFTLFDRVNVSEFLPKLAVFRKV